LDGYRGRTILKIRNQSPIFRGSVTP